jgi:TatD DNase family protein|tara:strand:- start:752 stop:1570 length:819 start_codon:yes stop_codon:yes gene_type:complete
MTVLAASNRLFDIGANLTNSRFDKDLPEVLQRAYLAGVAHIVVTGTSIEVSQRALALAQQYPRLLSCTAGIHPHDASSWNTDSADVIRNLANHHQVVALGECGLDFNRNYSSPEQQLGCFEAQLQLAAELNKPLFLHQRDAHDPFIKLIERYRSQLGNIVVHCFTGSKQEVQACIDLDCHIGITGWIADNKRGEELRQLVRAIPLDKLMIETDSPYLTPQNIRPKPKSRRNEPAYLPYVLQKLSEVMDIDISTLSKTVFTNSVEFFKLEPSQ